jgi:hypothetical protein
MAYLPTIVPKWFKVTKTFADFSAAALVNSISINTLPIKGVIHNIQINPRIVFSGGLIATYTISVGILGTLAKYAIATNVFTGAALPAISVLPGVESVNSTASILATAISTVGNLDAATQGTVDIWLLLSILP